MVKKILRLGDAALYRPSAEVRPDELLGLRGLAEDLMDTLADFRKRHGHGSALTAPQIGVSKRMFLVNLDEHPIYVINPIIHFPFGEKLEVMDDCTSFPQLHVKVIRYRQCALRYRNLDWQVRDVVLQEELSILVQHAVDHLDGMLATQRAVDERSLFFEPE